MVSVQYVIFRRQKLPEILSCWVGTDRYRYTNHGGKVQVTGCTTLESLLASFIFCVLVAPLQ